MRRSAFAVAAQLVQEARRALHVGEEERDGASRKLGYARIRCCALAGARKRLAAFL
jgi:hypothetical protein